MDEWLASLVAFHVEALPLTISDIVASNDDMEAYTKVGSVDIEAL